MKASPLWIDEFLERIYRWQTLGVHTSRHGIKVVGFVLDEEGRRRGNIHSLHPPLTIDDYASMERQLMATLPAGFRDLYTSMNGLELFNRYHVIGAYENFTGSKDGMIGVATLVKQNVEMLSRGSPRNFVYFGYTEAKYVMNCPLYVDLNSGRVYQGKGERDWEPEREWQSLADFLLSEFDRLNHLFDLETGKRLFMYANEAARLRQRTWPKHKKLAYRLGLLKDPNDEKPIG